MKVMFSAFAVAIILAASAGYLLNADVQMTAYERFVTSGAHLNSRTEAGTNLVGTDWSGLGRPSQEH